MKAQKDILEKDMSYKAKNWKIILTAENLKPRKNKHKKRGTNCSSFFMLIFS
jgi:hypothetical protein